MTRRFGPRATLALVAAVGALAAGCTLPGLVSGPVQLTATFEDVGDLVAGHSVEVADVQIGSITAIELTDDFRATVTMQIKDGLDLPANSTAVLRTTSLLGEKFIEIRPPEDAPEGGPVLEDEDVFERTQTAPEFEFVADQLITVLGAIAANDVATLVETGSVGFGGRGPELRRLVDDLSVISGTLADQTGNIVRIIDGLDQATGTLAGADGEIDQLLVNLTETTQVLVENRERAIEAIRQLTRLAAVQNDEVFEPYLANVDAQIKQLDAVLAEVSAYRDEVGRLLDWVEPLMRSVTVGIPGDFAQVYSWAILDESQPPPFGTAPSPLPVP